MIYKILKKKKKIADSKSLDFDLNDYLVTGGFAKRCYIRLTDEK